MFKIFPYDHTQSQVVFKSNLILDVEKPVTDNKFLLNDEIIGKLPIFCYYENHIYMWVRRRKYII